MQMEEVIEDIISMQSSYDDIQNYPDSVVQMPNTVSKVTEFFVLFCFSLAFFYVCTFESHKHILVCLALL